MLEPSVRAAYTPIASRDAGNGYQRLSSDFQVRLTAARVRLERIDLLGGASSSGPTSFDPANPPPGYTICHNGHCDREDGAQVSYDEVAAELGGGGATASTVATLPVGESGPAGTGDPHARVPAGLRAASHRALQRKVDRGGPAARGHREGFACHAALRGERPPSRAHREQPPGRARRGAHGELDVPADREHPPLVSLALGLEMTAAVFDPVDWEAAKPGTDDTVDLSDVDNEAPREQLLESFSELAPNAEVNREDR